MAGADPSQVEAAGRALIECFRAGGKVLLFGNGGSAADAQHMAAELVGRFLLDRPPLPALALTTDSSILTAVANDHGFQRVFARQVEALGRRGDVALAISMSGSSANVVEGVRAATAAGMRTVGLVGAAHSELAQLVDLLVVVDARGPRIQEGQLMVEHALCDLVETTLFGQSVPAWEPGLPVEARKKISDWDELLVLRERWRTMRARVVWTNGCFDLLHVGHIRSLECARALGDVLVVGVNDDASVRKLKGDSRPVVPAQQRAEVVAALEAVDNVVIFAETVPTTALARLQPDVHAKGADYSDALPERAVVEEYGGVVELLPLVPDVSTTALLSRLEARDLDAR